MAKGSGKSISAVEIASIIRTQSFVVESHLAQAKSADGENPMQIHNSKFSRYRFVIINDQKKAALGNIPVTAMVSILSKARVLADEEVRNALHAASANTGAALSPAYTQVFKAGNLRGKTPAAVLIEDPVNGPAILNGQYEYLKSRLGTYPRNKVMMGAIADAARLMKAGQLDAGKAQSGGAGYTIYDADLRSLRSKTRPDGMRFVYHLKITWTPGVDNPATVLIENYYAPVIELEGGRLNVQASAMDKSTLVKNQMAFSLNEWEWIMHMIESDLNRFELSVDASCRADAAQFAYNRQDSGGAQPAQDAAAYPQYGNVPVPGMDDYSIPPYDPYYGQN